MPEKALWIVLHALVWLAVYLLPYFVAYGNVSPGTIFREPGGIVHAGSTALLILYAYLNHYLLVPRLYLHRRYVVFALLVVACVLVVIWFPRVFGVFEHDGPLPPRPPGGKPRHGGPPPIGFFKLGYNIVLFVICTFASISIRQQQQLLEMQKEKLNAELSFLKAQINPHFLFNTLNSIYALAIRKSDEAPKAIIQLSELMRYILKESDATTVPLHKELDYIGNYIALQKRRLGNTAQISYTAPEETGNRRIAPLILMSFIENAFKHGVNPNQASVINISISLQDEQLHLLVLNNKVTAVPKEENMGIGLKNTISRLEGLYPGKHRLHIEDNEKTFSVNLTLYLND